MAEFAAMPLSTQEGSSASDMASCPSSPSHLESLSDALEGSVVSTMEYPSQCSSACDSGMTSPGELTSTSAESMSPLEVPADASSEPASTHLRKMPASTQAAESLDAVAASASAHSPSAQSTSFSPTLDTCSNEFVEFRQGGDPVEHSSQKGSPTSSKTSCVEHARCGSLGHMYNAFLNPRASSTQSESERVRASSASPTRGARELARRLRQGEADTFLTKAGVTGSAGNQRCIAPEILRVRNKQERLKKRLRCSPLGVEQSQQSAMNPEVPSVSVQPEASSGLPHMSVHPPPPCTNSLQVAPDLENMGDAALACTPTRKRMRLSGKQASPMSVEGTQGIMSPPASSPPMSQVVPQQGGLGVKLGCSKCRYLLNGCTACRTKAGLSPAQGLMRRGGRHPAALLPTE
eukprot:TRINITY_DN46997_c0_g1_i1.p1 TRINITY_DN46997_c0_g1~~TRINITY_DN46997_c0_g1_i1.p1  ORF type:complete len:406 (-),score=53.30 TRINITY_DN46997_c0_g1_i1:95-1312(-)